MASRFKRPPRRPREKKVRPETLTAKLRRIRAERATVEEQALAKFVAEYPNDVVGISELREAWGKAMPQSTRTVNWLSRRLAELGYERTRLTGGYAGVRLRSEVVLRLRPDTMARLRDRCGDDASISRYVVGLIEKAITGAVAATALG